MQIIGDTTSKIQNVVPGTYVWCEESEQFERVTEYPVTTSQAVFVNLSGGMQISGHLDSPVKVAMWDASA